MKKKKIIFATVAAAALATVVGIVIGCKKHKKYGQGRKWFDDYDPCDYIYEEDNDDE